MKPSVIFVVVLAMLTVTCESPTAPSDSELSIRTVYREEVTGLRQPVHRLINTEAEWQDLWDEIQSNRQLPAPAPFIDFTQDVLIVASMNYANRGASVEIRSVKQLFHGLLVDVQEVIPGSKCGQLPATSAPVHVVAIERGRYIAEFRVTRDAIECM